MGSQTLELAVAYSMRVYKSYWELHMQYMHNFGMECFVAVFSG